MLYTICILTYHFFGNWVDFFPFLFLFVRLSLGVSHTHVPCFEYISFSHEMRKIIIIIKIIIDKIIRKGTRQGTEVFLV